MKTFTKLAMRLGTTLLIVISLISSNPAFSQTSPIDESLKMLEKNQPTKAVQTMTQEVQKNPTPVNWFYLGYAQLKAGDNATALQSFDKGIAMDEKHALPYAGKGYLRTVENNAAEAKILFDKALSLSKSKNSEVLKVIGEAYLLNPKTGGEAVKLLEKAVSIDNTDAEASILLGDAYLLQNNGGMAASAYEKAAKQDAKSAAPHYKLGLLYLRSKNTTVALEELNKAISIDPNYTLAYKELGEYYYLTKQGDEAVKAHEAYLKLTEKPELEQFKYAFYLFMAKKYAKANQIFSDLIKKPDATSTTYRFYGRSLIESGDTLGSSKILEAYFVKAKPEEIDASDYAYYGNMLRGMKKDSLAAVNFEKSLTIDPNQPDVLQRLADTYYKNKKYSEAAKTYKILLSKRTKPLSKDYYSLGRAYYFNNQFMEADTSFSKLAELQPNMTLPYLWSGRSKASLDPESAQGLAKPMYEKVIEKGTPEKNKNDIIEAYHYLGSYYVAHDKLTTAKPYFEKILVIDSKNNAAVTAVKAINEALAPPKKDPKQGTTPKK